MRFTLIFLFVTITIAPLVSAAGLKELFRWTKIAFKWGDTENQNLELDSPLYEYIIPTGASVWNNKLILSIPRSHPKVPATLAFIPLNSTSSDDVPLSPYPNWNLNSLNSDNKELNFVSVYRTYVDACDRLWFVDTGIIEATTGQTIVRPPTLVVMDLRTDKLIGQYAIPDDQHLSSSILSSLTVDSASNACDDAFAYIPDQRGYGLIVYSLKSNKSWRLSHNYFFLEPRRGDFYIFRERFQWNDGISSISLTNPGSDGYRDAYFHSLAGLNIYKVSTKVLQNETLAKRPYHADDFKFLYERNPLYQSSTSELDKPRNTLFLGLVNLNAIGCWNVNRPIQSMSIVAKDSRRLIYPSDIKISNDKIYVLTNNLPGFLYKKLNWDKPNFRIWSSDIESALEDTYC